MTKDSFVILAIVTGAHGIKGEVKLRSYTSPKEAIKEYDGLQSSDGQPVSLSIRGQAKDTFICRLKGIDTRNEAETIKGMHIGLPRHQLPTLEEDENTYYQHDLIGREVILADGSLYGIVIGMHDFGAGDIVEIKRQDDAKTEMQAFTSATFPYIDRENKRITIQPPELI